MSHLTNESEDGVLSKDQTGSPLIDEGNSSGSAGGGVVLKKGPWTSSEDAILVEYVKKHGEGNWNAVQKHSGLFRCGKSCRLRWANHLRPNLKKGAFTAEEERLIIELHAKMGNKWARMAAHLPGRTDNEIKNYWNTRIKRRQRAGLPLYPPEVGFQSLPESQQIQNSGGVNGGDKVHHDLLQTNGYEIPDVILDGFKANQDNFPFVPEFPNLSANSMLMKGFSSSQYCGFMSPTMHRPKRVRESPAIFPGYNERNGIPLFDQIQDDTGDKIAQSLGLPYPFDPDPTNKDPLPFSGMLGSHTLLNGNFSASKPIYGPVKLELPSLQYLETDLGGWGTSLSPPPSLESVDAFIQSPPSGLVQLECLSPRNSGLLDALLHEAKTISSGKNHLSDKSANSSTVIPGDLADSCLNMSETEWEDYGGDPISPLGHSTTSIFSECTPISASGSSLDEHPHAETFAGCSVKAEPVDQVWTPDGEKETSTQLDFSRPDLLLGSSWIDQSVGGVPKDQAMMNDAVATLFSDDFGNSYKNMAPGTPPTSSQGWGFGGCAWNNMPAVCQMSELP